MIRMNLFTKQKQTHRMNLENEFMVTGGEGKDRLGVWD